MNAILAADEELLTLSLVVHPGQTIHYRRTIDDHFEFEEEAKPSHWHEDVIGASIHGRFYASARAIGLSDGEIFRAQRIFEERVNFRRNIPRGTGSRSS